MSIFWNQHCGCGSHLQCYCLLSGICTAVAARTCIAIEFSLAFALHFCPQPALQLSSFRHLYCRRGSYLHCY